VAEAQARLDEAELTLRQATSLRGEGFASESRVLAVEAAVSAARSGVKAALTGLETARSGQMTVQAAQEQARAGVETARAGVQGAEAGVAAAENEIGKLTLTAPFGGLLETDSAETGALLQPGALCATIVQLDPIKLVGFVAETDVARVATGAAAGARLADGREVRGIVTYAARSADEATRTFRVEVEVPNADRSIRDGQTAEILIASEGTLAHLLPSSALTLDDKGALGIRAVEAGLAAFKPVGVLRDTVEGIWVTGLPASVDVIVVGQEFVTDGVAVEPTYREAL
jgi:multidrug efflux system membrane fusion protein